MPRRGPLVVLFVAAAVAIAGAIWAWNVLDVRARSPLATVASAFDAPPAYPGYRWTRDGHEAGEFELTSIAGPAGLRLLRSTRITARRLCAQSFFPSDFGIQPLLGVGCQHCAVGDRGFAPHVEHAQRSTVCAKRQ